MHGIYLNLPQKQSRTELLIGLELLTRGNTRWYIREWMAGRDPACCCGCAGVKYKPDRLVSQDVELTPAPVVFQSKIASCGQAASISAANHRAKVMRDQVGLAALRTWANGGDDPEIEDLYQQTRGMWGLDLIEQTPGYYHAVVIDPAGKIDDPTTEMEVA